MPVMVQPTATYATIESARVVLTTLPDSVLTANVLQLEKQKVMVLVPVRLVQSDPQMMTFVKIVIQVVPPVLQM